MKKVNVFTHFRVEFQFLKRGESTIYALFWFYNMNTKSRPKAEWKKYMCSLTFGRDFDTIFETGAKVKFMLYFASTPLAYTTKGVSLWMFCRKVILTYKVEKCSCKHSLVCTNLAASALFVNTKPASGLYILGSGHDLTLHNFSQQLGLSVISINALCK